MITLDNINSKQYKIYVKRMENGIGIRCVNCITGDQNIVIITSKTLNPKDNSKSNTYTSNLEEKNNNKGMISVDMCKKSFITPNNMMSYLREIYPHIEESRRAKKNQEPSVAAFIESSIPNIRDVSTSADSVNGSPINNLVNLKENSSIIGLDSSLNVDLEDKIYRVNLSLDLSPPYTVKTSKTTQTRKNYSLKRSADTKSSTTFGLEPLYNSLRCTHLDEETQTEEIQMQTVGTQTYCYSSTVDCETQTKEPVDCTGIHDCELKKIEINEQNQHPYESLLSSEPSDDNKNNISNSLKTFDSHLHFGESSKSEMLESNLHKSLRRRKYYYRLVSVSSSEDQSDWRGRDSNDSSTNENENEIVLTLFDNTPDYKPSQTFQAITYKVNSISRCSSQISSSSENSDEGVEPSYSRLNDESLNETSEDIIRSKTSVEILRIYKNEPLEHFDTSTSHLSFMQTSNVRFDSSPFQTGSENEVFSFDGMSKNLPNQNKQISEKLPVQDDGVISSQKFFSVVTSKATAFKHSDLANDNESTMLISLCEYCGLYYLNADAANHVCGELCNKHSSCDEKDIYDGHQQDEKYYTQSKISLNTIDKLDLNAKKLRIFYNKKFTSSSSNFINTTKKNNDCEVIKYNVLAQNDVDCEEITRGITFYNSKIYKQWAEEQNLKQGSNHTNTITQAKSKTNYFDEELIKVTNYQSEEVGESISRHPLSYKKLCVSDSILLEDKSQTVDFRGKRSVKSWMDVTIRSTISTRNELKRKIPSLYSTIKPISECVSKELINTNCYYTKNKLFEKVSRNKLLGTLDQPLIAELDNDNLHFKQKSNISISTVHLVPSHIELIQKEQISKPLKNKSSLLSKNAFKRSSTENSRESIKRKTDQNSNVNHTKKSWQQISLIPSKKIIGYMKNSHMFKNCKTNCQISSKESLNQDEEKSPGSSREQVHVSSGYSDNPSRDILDLRCVLETNQLLNNKEVVKVYSKDKSAGNEELQDSAKELTQKTLARTDGKSVMTSRQKKAFRSRRKVKKTFCSVM